MISEIPKISLMLLKNTYKKIDLKIYKVINKLWIIKFWKIFIKKF